MLMKRDQYVVTAVYKEDGKATVYPRLVTYNRDEAYNFDVTSYRGTRWNIFVQHFTVDETNAVVDQGGAYIIYPTQG